MKVNDNLMSTESDTVSPEEVVSPQKDRTNITSSSRNTTPGNNSRTYLPSGSASYTQKPRNPNAVSNEVHYYEGHLSEEYYLGKDIPNSEKLKKMGMTVEALQKETKYNLICPITLELPRIPVHMPSISTHDIFELNALIGQTKPDDKGKRPYPGRQDVYFTLEDIKPAHFINQLINALYKAEKRKSEYSSPKK